MSIEKIRALNQVAKEMEEMKKKAIGEIKDRMELRLQALEKIQNYLRELSNATSGFSWSAETPISIYWLVKQNEMLSKNYSGVRFWFNENGTVDIYQSAAASSLDIPNFTNLKRTDFYRICGNTMHWNDGMVELIERWKEIKPYLEQGAESALIKRMNKTQKELAEFKASYEKVVDFEV